MKAAGIAAIVIALIALPWLRAFFADRSFEKAVANSVAATARNGAADPGDVERQIEVSARERGIELPPGGVTFGKRGDAASGQQISVVGVRYQRAIYLGLRKEVSFEVPLAPATRPAIQPQPPPPAVASAIDAAVGHGLSGDPVDDDRCARDVAPQRRELAGQGYELLCGLVDGKPDGLYRKYDLSHQLRLRGRYDAGMKKGLWTTWRGNGVRESEIEYFEDQKSGLETQYNASGSKILVGHWRQGQKHGLWEEYTPNGALFRESNYRQGLLNGRETVYAEDGTRLSEGHFVDDKKSGHWVHFYRSGHKAAEGDFGEGVEIGVWRVWDENGQEQPARRFEKGQVTLVEEPVARCPAGAVARRIESTSMREVWCERTTNNTRRVGRKSYPSTKIERHGPATAFYRTGSKAFEGQWANGVKDGRWIYYRSDGQVSREEIWNRGVLVTESYGR
ncbi:MAG: toxin-antitoxin system YwqK family antitoxin [Deltaproteobacteria bacterium]|nr:toxin-antitoxin system YwqK family antitoxin [Deltaproteobacteria bacterium]